MVISEGPIEFRSGFVHDLIRKQKKRVAITCSYEIAILFVELVENQVVLGVSGSPDVPQFGNTGVPRTVEPTSQRVKPRTVDDDTRDEASKISPVKMECGVKVQPQD
jgi:hypothetical protein